MATTIVDGIILDSIEYAEFDRIITIFTQKLGKFTLLARGTNRLTSKNRYSLGTFNYSEVEFFKARKTDNLSKLKTSRIIQNYDSINKYYPSYLYASALAYLIHQGLEIWQIEKELYENFVLALNNFEERYEILRSFVYFLFYSLPTFGGPKNRGSCFRCNEAKTNYALFEIYDLCFVCYVCQSETEKSQDPGWIKFIYYLSTHKMREVLDWPIAEQYVIILGKILLNYYREALGLDSLVLRLVDQKPIFKSLTNELISFLLKQ